MVLLLGISTDVRILPMVTFRLTVEQFQSLLLVILADDTPDQLSDLVLLNCTRPHDGTISVPVPTNDAAAIAAVVQDAANRNSAVKDVADLINRQLTDAMANFHAATDGPRDSKL